MDRVRVGTALLAGVIVLVHGAGANAVLPLVLLFLLVPITVVDLERRIIPDAITAPGAAGAIAIGLVGDPSAAPGQPVPGLAAGGVLPPPAAPLPPRRGLGGGE